MSSPTERTRLTETPSNSKLRYYQIVVGVVTFLIYAVFHLARKVFSIIKTPLNPKDDPLAPVFPPFTPNDATRLLGALDTIYLTTYGIALFYAGHIADRSRLNIFIALGLLGVAFSLILWTVAYVVEIHTIVFFIFANILAGIFHSFGWPGVVAAMSRWFPKGKRGTLMGLWNSHTSVGNMLGSIVCTAALGMGMNGYGWPYAFAVPSVVCVLTALLCYFFLVNDPADVGCTIEHESDKSLNEVQSTEPEEQSMLLPSAVVEIHNESNGIVSSNEVEEPTTSHVSFCQALLIPGVIEFSLALFFCKLVSYTFLFWLPTYLTSIEYTKSEAGYLSTFVDLGGIVGGITAGFFADKTQKPGIVSVCFLVFTAPFLILYRHLTGEKIVGMGFNIVLLFVLGFFVNGPYALITTSVSADLGSHPMLGNDASALATVTGIIDGTGTFGAAAQGVLVSLLSTIDHDGDGQDDKDQENNWNLIYFVLAGCALVSTLCLTRIFLREFKEYREAVRNNAIIEAENRLREQQNINQS